MTLVRPIHPQGDAVATHGAAVICESDLPLAAIPAAGRFALAVITGVEGASYRPLGAMMIVDAESEVSGSLSSGCLDRDVALRAQQSLADRRPAALRYGRGSAMLDITLPCGGGLDIRILPDPDRALLAACRAELAARRPARLVVGADGLAAPGAAGMALTILPAIRFVVIGKGTETTVFAELARGAGYQVDLFSPDPDPLAQPLPARGWPQAAATDDRTAVTLFFHDHDLEPPLLQAALAGPAFYVGAQGSLRAHQTRCAALRARGVDEAAIARLASPFGLIPSARDPRTLAVSVLADVLARAQQLAG